MLAQLVIPTTKPESSIEPKLSLGGKGAGLVELLKTSTTGGFYTVPEYTVIPVSERKDTTKPLMIKHNVTATKFAVRSSGTVSMPGMMETKLNVPSKGLSNAVKAVWASYDSPHCKLYRETNGIEGGLAVVIQAMVDAKISGVIFTNDPTSYNKKLFQPSIQYVEGLGDSLVGGTVTPSTMDSSHPNYAVITAAARIIHNKYGASDIEFSIGKDDKLYLLQLRPLVFTPEPPKDLEVEVDTIVCTGVSIACSGSVVGTLCDVDDEPESTDYFADKIVFVDTFLPEHYEVMMKSKAIITTEGGSHCHAAIVARTLGKLAISGIKYDELEKYMGKEIFVRTKDGIVATVKHGADTSNTVIQGSAVEVPDIDLKYRMPCLDTLQRSVSGKLPAFTVSADNLAGQFYVGYDSYMNNALSKADFTTLLETLSMHIGTYIVAACIGEFRHTSVQTVCLSIDGVDALAVTDALETLQDKWFVKECFSSGIGRSSFISNKLDRIPKTLNDAVDMMSNIATVFNKGNWNGAYGGKAWGKIANLWLRFASGKLSALLFLDAVFNMQHNSGNIFGKLNWLNRGINLGNVLNAKRLHSVNEILYSATLNSEMTIPMLLSTKYVPTNCTEECRKEVDAAATAQH